MKKNNDSRKILFRGVHPLCILSIAENKASFFDHWNSYIIFNTMVQNFSGFERLIQVCQRKYWNNNKECEKVFKDLWYRGKIYQPRLNGEPPYRRKLIDGRTYIWEVYSGTLIQIDPTWHSFISSRYDSDGGLPPSWIPCNGGICPRCQSPTIFIGTDCSIIQREGYLSCDEEGNLYREGFHCIGWKCPVCNECDVDVCVHD